MWWYLQELFSLWKVHSKKIKIIKAKQTKDNKEQEIYQILRYRKTTFMDKKVYGTVACGTRKCVYKYCDVIN